MTASTRVFPSDFPAGTRLPMLSADQVEERFVTPVGGAPGIVRLVPHKEGGADPRRVGDILYYPVLFSRGHAPTRKLLRRLFGKKERGDQREWRSGRNGAYQHVAVTEKGEALAAWCSTGKQEEIQKLFPSTTGIEQINEGLWLVRGSVRKLLGDAEHGEHHEVEQGQSLLDEELKSALQEHCFDIVRHRLPANPRILLVCLPNSHGTWATVKHSSEAALRTFVAHQSTIASLVIGELAKRTTAYVLLESFPRTLTHEEAQEIVKAGFSERQYQRVADIVRQGDSTVTEELITLQEHFREGDPSAENHARDTIIATSHIGRITAFCLSRQCTDRIVGDDRQSFCDFANLNDFSTFHRTHVSIMETLRMHQENGTVIFMPYGAAHFDVHAANANRDCNRQPIDDYLKDIPGLEIVVAYDTQCLTTLNKHAAWVSGKLERTEAYLTRLAAEERKVVGELARGGLSEKSTQELRSRLLEIQKELRICEDVYNRGGDEDFWRKRGILPVEKEASPGE